jgi:UDP-N-acetylglucosamine 2-epimerase (non-hydrolysing)
MTAESSIRQRILHVVGARPNFMKTAPVMAEMSRRPAEFEQLLVHTGQHYDFEMSEVFFRDLDMPEPDRFLHVGSGSHAEQTARIMLAFEPVVQDWRPDWVVVVGDVNSTVACALVCAKVGVRVAHVEAGLRSRDRTMPEEVNRLLTDQLADLMLTPSRDADANLRSEGVDRSKIEFVGNVMIDTLVKNLANARARPVVSRLGLDAASYALVTLHRPSNVDDPARLREVVEGLRQIGGSLPVVFPVHPRTRKNLDERMLSALSGRVTLLDPLGYLDFVALLDSARLVVTDSGGLQEESTYLGVPCLTLRPNTERPITITCGTNRLVACDRDALVAAASAAKEEPRATHAAPELWDGAAAARVVRAVAERASPSGHPEGVARYADRGTTGPGRT